MYYCIYLNVVIHRQQETHINTHFENDKKKTCDAERFGGHSLTNLNHSNNNRNSHKLREWSLCVCKAASWSYGRWAVDTRVGRATTNTHHASLPQTIQNIWRIFIYFFFLFLHFIRPQRVH